MLFRPTSGNLNINRNRQQNMNPNVDMSLYAGIPGPYDVDHSSGCNNTLENCNNSVVNLKLFGIFVVETRELWVINF